MTKHANLSESHLLVVSGYATAKEPLLVALSAVPGLAAARSNGTSSMAGACKVAALAEKLVQWEGQDAYSSQQSIAPFAIRTDNTWTMPSCSMAS